MESFIVFFYFLFIFIFYFWSNLSLETIVRASDPGAILKEKKDWGPRFISQRHLISLVFKSPYKCGQTDTLPLTNTSNLFIARKGKKKEVIWAATLIIKWPTWLQSIWASPQFNGYYIYYDLWFRRCICRAVVYAISRTFAVMRSTD